MTSVRIDAFTGSKDSVSFTPRKLKKFRKAYTKCLDKGDEVFTFEGNEFYAGYAKYLIEYMESEFYDGGGGQ